VGWKPSSWLAPAQVPKLVPPWAMYRLTEAPDANISSSVDAASAASRT
jgi:hypothetical protein